ncbi:hypothetical protein ACF1AJ_14055 [Leifsonia sp. NPDC014704]|uniref:hypothetical protein n=1 Tax=Leifsonia sp. NPDC014704 TaxID=3364123 RepID=UPI0036F4A570
MRTVIYDEVDGLDETSAGVPIPHSASDRAGDFAMPTVLPKRVPPLAGLALALALVLPVVAVPLGYHVTRKLHRVGGKGVAVAQAAIIVGYLNILLITLVSLNVAVAVLL